MSSMNCVSYFSFGIVGLEVNALAPGKFPLGASDAQGWGPPWQTERSSDSLAGDLTA